MKKVLRRIVLVVMMVPILLIIVSLFLPAKYRVERSVAIKAPPESIHPWISQLNRWPEWTVYNTNYDSTLVYTYSGPTEGAGATMRWNARSGAGQLKLTSADPKTGVTFELNFENGRFVSTGGITLAAGEPGTTRATWHNEGKLGWNPVARYFGLFMDSMMGKDFEKNLEGLRRKAEGQVTNSASIQ